MSPEDIRNLALEEAPRQQRRTGNMRRFVTNTALLTAMNKASEQGRVVSSLDAVAGILDVNVEDIRWQARNLATKSLDLGARRFIEGRTKGRY
jgi:hypothetical protein